MHNWIKARVEAYLAGHYTVHVVRAHAFGGGVVAMLDALPARPGYQPEGFVAYLCPNADETVFKVVWCHPAREL